MDKRSGTFPGRFAFACMVPRAVWSLVAAAALSCGAPSEQEAQASGEWRTDFSRHTVPLEEIVSGGPPKDGIPAIDEPRFEDARRASRWLKDREPVIVVEHRDVARAYPYQILVWHEIVNDRIGDLPMAVTFCPLCNIAVVFDRRHKGRVLDFGTTGRLRHSDLIMYDRQTETWWQQATGRAIVGALAGDSLRTIDAQTVSWKAFRTAHPTGQVLSRPAGFDRPYGRNPYAGYDAPTGNPIAGFFTGKKDDRLPAMERVAAVHIGSRAVAYPFSRLREVGVVNDEIGGQRVVVFWAPGTASALDRDDIASGRDVGATGVFAGDLEGRRLTFEAVGASAFRDSETGSRWDILGRAVAGPLKGKRLRRVQSGDYLWFAWAVFRPDTRIWP